MKCLKIEFGEMVKTKNVTVKCCFVGSGRVEFYDEGILRKQLNTV